MCEDLPKCLIWFATLCQTQDPNTRNLYPKNRRVEKLA